MVCIIYALKNKCNDKVYIGQTWQSLKSRFSKYDKKCYKLHNAFNKYNKDNFYYDILAICESQDNADYCERFFINHYDSINNGYNIKSGGARGCSLKHTEATKKKMSKSHTGKKLSEVTKSKLLGNKNASGTRTPEQKNKMRLSHLGKKQTEEHKLKKSISLKKFYADKRSKK